LIRLECTINFGTETRQKLTACIIIIMRLKAENPLLITTCLFDYKQQMKFICAYTLGPAFKLQVIGKPFIR
jgi:hypothetical protein